MNSYSEKIDGMLAGHGNKVAVVTPDGQKLTYLQFVSTIRSFAAKLRSMGARPAQVIAAFNDNPAVFYALSFAIPRIGATLTCIPSVEQGAIDGLLTDFAVTLPDRPAKTTRNLVFGQDWISFRGNGDVGPPGGYIYASSGTTGKRKYYFAPQSMVAARIEHRAGILGRNPLHTLMTMPVFSGFGLVCLEYTNTFGGTVSWPGTSAMNTLQSLRPEHPVEIICTPSSLADYVAAIEAGASVPRHMARVIVAGSTIASELVRKAEDKFGCPVLNCYGSAEAGANTFNRVPMDGPSKGFVGKPIHATEFLIEDDDGHTVPANQEGNVKVLVPPACRIGHVLIGSSPYDANGSFASGDLGYLNERGELFITGRVGELINSSGLKVAPDRYEALALKFVNATQVAAFGIPNRIGSEDVGVALVSENKIDLERLTGRMQEVLGNHMKVVAFQVQVFPVSESGKVDRVALRKLLVP